MRILFVENHVRFARTVIDQFLSQHEVTRSGSVERAKELAKENAYEAVLVDYDLDDAKGDVLVAWLRRTGFAGPVVAVSARDEGNEALMRAGASGVCRKGDFHLIRRHLQP